MTKEKRIRKRRGIIRHGSRRQRHPPGLLTLIGWFVPIATFAGLIDWSLYQQAMDHRRQHGHISFSMQVLGLAFVFTCTALTIPFIWLHERRQTINGMSKNSKT